MRRLFHLQKKSDNSHKYYGSLSALCNDNADLGVSKFTLDKGDVELIRLKHLRLKKG